MVDALYSAAVDVVLDVPGGAVGDLMRTFSGGARALVAECKAAGREVIVCSVIGIKKDSVASAQQAVEVFGADVHHVIVKNGLWVNRATSSFTMAWEAASLASMVYFRHGLFRRRGDHLPFRASHQLPTRWQKMPPLLCRGCNSYETLGRRHAANVRYWLDEARDTFAGTWLDVTGAVPSKGRRERVAVA